MAHKFFVSILLAIACTQASFGAHHEALIQDALAAAPPTLVDSVSVVDWDGNVLRQGTSDYTCMPTPPNVAGTQPMCLDGPWKTWADAWSNKKPLNITRLGISYMLLGDEGASRFLESPVRLFVVGGGQAGEPRWLREGDLRSHIVRDGRA